jgi:hypothetical protein
MIAYSSEYIVGKTAHELSAAPYISQATITSRQTPKADAGPAAIVEEMWLLIPDAGMFLYRRMWEAGAMVGRASGMKLRISQRWGACMVVTSPWLLAWNSVALDKAVRKSYL